jgi:hypothetical protein
MEYNLEVSQKLKIELPYDPAIIFTLRDILEVM